MMQDNFKACGQIGSIMNLSIHKQNEYEAAKKETN